LPGRPLARSWANFTNVFRAEVQHKGHPLLVCQFHMEQHRTLIQPFLNSQQKLNRSRNPANGLYFYSLLFGKSVVGYKNGYSKARRTL
jgi:hypothetical protein